jgi:hypothetical protein
MTAEQLDLVQDIMDLMPELRADAKRMSVEELREKYRPLITANQIQTALVSPDAKARLSAAKDILDRAEGKALERREEMHRFEKNPDQLDALLQTKLQKVLGTKKKSETKH